MKFIFNTKLFRKILAKKNIFFEVMNCTKFMAIKIEMN